MVTPENRQEILRYAKELFKQDPPWMDFFREIFGSAGIIKTFYEHPSDFDSYPEYEEIQQMLKTLKQRQNSVNSEPVPQSSITVRLPKALHEQLKREAKKRNQSLNAHCIDKFIQPTEEDDDNDAEIS